MLFQQTINYTSTVGVHAAVMEWGYEYGKRCRCPRYVEYGVLFQRDGRSQQGHDLAAH